MTAPTRARTTRNQPFGLPLIPRRTREEDERAQIQFMVWRLELFMRDAHAPKRAKQFRLVCETAWKGGAPYARMCEIIEEHMIGFLAAQAQTIQSIYNEK